MVSNANLHPYTAGAVLAGSVASPSPAGAVTANQLLFLEAWRAVDKAYVDKTFNGGGPMQAGPDLK